MSGAWGSQSSAPGISGNTRLAPTHDREGAETHQRSFLANLVLAGLSPTFELDPLIARLVRSALAARGISLSTIRGSWVLRVRGVEMPSLGV